MTTDNMLEETAPHCMGIQPYSHTLRPFYVEAPIYYRTPIMWLENEEEEESKFFRSEVSVDKRFVRLLDCWSFCNPRQQQVEETSNDNDTFETFALSTDKLSISPVKTSVNRSKESDASRQSMSRQKDNAALKSTTKAPSKQNHPSRRVLFPTESMKSLVEKFDSPRSEVVQPGTRRSIVPELESPDTTDRVKSMDAKLDSGMEPEKPPRSFQKNENVKQTNHQATNNGSLKIVLSILFLLMPAIAWFTVSNPSNAPNTLRSIIKDVREQLKENHYWLQLGEEAAAGEETTKTQNVAAAMTESPMEVEEVVTLSTTDTDGQLSPSDNLAEKLTQQTDALTTLFR
jgi:hypothetical protein